MTKVEELLALANRCEREEASRELHCALAHTLGWLQVTSDLPSYWLDPDGDIWNLPDWLTSVGDAKLLEPKDAQEICVRIYRKGAYVRITVADGTPVYCEALSSPITEAMARCVAALRARAYAVSCKAPGAMRSEAEPVPSSPKVRQSPIPENPQ